MSAYVGVNVAVADTDKYRANFQKAAAALHDWMGVKQVGELAVN
jgi:hypothetical protein